MTPLRIVSPYRPFAPESDEHHILGPFDWVGALAMLQDSARRVVRHVEAVAITDVDAAPLGVPSLLFQTTERRLMLWILDVSLQYLQSEAFDRDTVLVSPDMLLLQDPRPWFHPDAHLGVLVRTSDKHRQSGRMILNQMQWWPVAGKAQLVHFYRQALEIARALPEDVIRWGADSVPLQQLLDPIEQGVASRAGLVVSMIEAEHAIESLSSYHIQCLEGGLPLGTSRTALDFRYLRKHRMREAYNALFGEVPTCN
jgi:hypothetical protein